MPIKNVILLMDSIRSHVESQFSFCLKTSKTISENTGNTIALKLLYIEERDRDFQNMVYYCKQPFIQLM